MDFKGKIVIITGGTSGIGFCIINKLLTTDIKAIALFELETTSSTTVFAELQKQHGNRIDFYPCDVTNTSLLEANFDKVLQKYGYIDILINNAGIGSEFDTERMIDINYKAVILGSLMLINRVGKHKGGNGATIINIASILGLQNLVAPIYSSAKSAVITFTRTMKDVYDKTGVRVIALCPGATNTAILESVVNGLDFVDYKKLGILPEPQSPEIVANALIDVVIIKGNNGDVWVSEEEQAPYLIQAVEDYKSLRIN